MLRSVEVRTLREALRTIRDLRAVLGEMLDDAEEMALGYYPGGRGQLDSVLAHEMRYGDDECALEDLRRIKRARRALGLPSPVPAGRRPFVLTTTARSGHGDDL